MDPCRRMTVTRNVGFAVSRAVRTSDPRFPLAPTRVTFSIGDVGEGAMVAEPQWIERREEE